jgi:hypothetical protein
MKQKFLIAATVSLLLSAAASSAFAAGTYPNVYGEPGVPSVASNTFTVGADTDHVNVTRRDTVDFLVDGKAYTWDYDVAGNIQEVDLNKVLPAGTLNHTVKVYIKSASVYNGA